MAAGARYECSLREFAAMGGKAGIPRGTFRLVKRPSDLIPWVIFQRRSTHIGLWSPPRPSRISQMVGAHPRECSRVAPAARLTVSCADRADARENPVGNRRPGGAGTGSCPLPPLWPQGLVPRRPGAYQGYPSSAYFRQGRSPMAIVINALGQISSPRAHWPTQGTQTANPGMRLRQPIAVTLSKAGARSSCRREALRLGAHPIEVAPARE